MSEAARLNGSAAGDDAVVIPVIEERLAIEKRQVETARTRVRKRVERLKSVVDEPVIKRTQTITRVPVDRVVEAPAEPRYEADGTLVIPVYEERMVLEKRLVLVEEVRITPVTEESRHRGEYELLKEEITIERTPTRANKER